MKTSDIKTIVILFFCFSCTMENPAARLTVENTSFEDVSLFFFAEVNQNNNLNELDGKQLSSSIIKANSSRDVLVSAQRQFIVYDYNGTGGFLEADGSIFIFDFARNNYSITINKRGWEIVE